MAHQGIFVLAILSIVFSFSSANTNFVSDVQQNYKPNTNTKVVDQITLELQASYIYQGYASYFQRADVALPGVQKFFAAAALEEREHAQMLIDYINERGGNNQFEQISINSACQAVKTDDITKKVHQKKDDDTDEADFEAMQTFCICHFVATESTSSEDFNHCTKDRNKWKNALNAFHDALLLERYVNQKLLDLHKFAEDEKDAHLAHLVEHQLLDEQVKSIYQLASYVTRLKSFDKNYQLGEYLFDQRLK